MANASCSLQELYYELKRISPDNELLRYYSGKGELKFNPSLLSNFLRKFLFSPSGNFEEAVEGYIIYLKRAIEHAEAEKILSSSKQRRENKLEDSVFSKEEIDAIRNTDF